jgi:hyperosmotically inducible periplasmic protein
MKALPLTTMVLAILAGCSRQDAGPQTTQRDATNAEVRTSVHTDADNTAFNQRDEHTVLKTPIDQNENQADINITADIRRRVVNTEGMSINARNVKIITQDGKVTLRGPVKSMDEREKIGQIAMEVAGKDNVNNMIEVEANP